MLQKNTSGYPLILPTLDPPVTVPAGEDIDHDTALAGFTPVDQIRDGGEPKPGKAPEQARDKPTTSRNPQSSGTTNEPRREA